MNYHQIIETPFGPMTPTVGETGALTKLYFGAHNPLGSETSSDKVRHVAQQLQEYFTGKRTTFDLELDPVGTAFQKRVWKLLLQIPFGQTRSYGALAQQLGQPTASRAVGMANARNPIAIIVPCHRVIGTSGKLTGYAGGLDMKERLLAFEKGITMSLFD